MKSILAIINHQKKNQFDDKSLFSFDRCFLSISGGFDEDNDNNDMKEDHDSDEDPWADKTKEISFSNKSPEKSSSNCALTENNDKGSSSDEEDQIAKSSLKTASIISPSTAAAKDSSLSSDKSSSSTVQATIESNSKMEIDGEDNNDDGMYLITFSQLIVYSVFFKSVHTLQPFFQKKTTN